MFSSVPFASYSFGILLVYALGTVLQWRYVAGKMTKRLYTLNSRLIFLIPFP